MREAAQPEIPDAQFRALAEASRDAVAIVDAAGTVVFMNAAAVAVCGTAGGEAPPARLADWIAATDLIEAERMVAATASGAAGVTRGTIRIRHCRRPEPVACAWCVFRLAAAGQPLVGIVAYEAARGHAGTPLAREVAALEALSLPPRETAVTARLLGVVELHQRAPAQYWTLYERYLKVLDAALDRQTYRDAAAATSTELRAIAESLAALDAGAREVAELHARALRQKARESSVAKAQAYASEGRLVAFELMGCLLSLYRRRAAAGIVDRG